MTTEGRCHQPLPYYNTVLLGHVLKTVEQTALTGRWSDSLPPLGSQQYCNHAYQGAYNNDLTSMWEIFNSMLNLQVHLWTYKKIAQFSERIL